jgi:5'(3')-deoxyribonucleotidase
LGEEEEVTDKPTLAIDFDGVLRPSFGEPSDDTGMVPHALDAVHELQERFRIVVHTCRARDPAGADMVGKWLRARGIHVDEVTALKPDAVAYIDDRAVRFCGWEDGAMWSLLDELDVAPSPEEP